MATCGSRAEVPRSEIDWVAEKVPSAAQMRKATEHRLSHEPPAGRPSLLEPLPKGSLPETLIVAAIGGAGRGIFECPLIGVPAAGGEALHELGGPQDAVVRRGPRSELARAAGKGLTL